LIKISKGSAMSQSSFSIIVLLIAFGSFFNTGVESRPHNPIGLSQPSPGEYIKKCFYESVTNNKEENIFSQTQNDQIMDWNREKRSPQTFGYKGSTQQFNSRPKLEGELDEFRFRPANEYNQAIFNLAIKDFKDYLEENELLGPKPNVQDSEEFVERCVYEKVSNTNSKPSKSITEEDAERKKRSAQYFGYNNSQQNYRGSHFQGGSHNFGHVGNYGGSHFQGGAHNFGHQSYNQHGWGSW